MALDQGVFPTDREIDESVDHYFSVVLGATNGRWWDGKRHCSSPTVEARETVGFMKAMRDHEIEWRAKANRYEVSCSKDPAQFRRFHPEVVAFSVVCKGSAGKDCSVRVEILVRTIHPKKDSSGVRFFGNSLPPLVSSGMSYYLRGEYDWRETDKVGVGWIETEWVISPEEVKSH